jgi:hypothetical protein
MDVRREGPRNVRVCAESGDLNECPQQDELNQASQCLISRWHHNDRIARVDGDTIYRGGSYDKFSYDWLSVYLRSGENIREETIPSGPVQYFFARPAPKSRVVLTETAHIEEGVVPPLRIWNIV